MPQEIEIHRAGKRLQIVWVAFVVIAVPITRIMARYGLPLATAKSIYLSVCCVAMICGIVAYRRDVDSDLGVCGLNNRRVTRFSVGIFVATAMLFVVALGLFIGVWEIRLEPLIHSLLLPFNAMFLYLVYMSYLRAKVKADWN